MLRCGRTLLVLVLPIVPHGPACCLHSPLRIFQTGVGISMTKDATTAQELAFTTAVIIDVSRRMLIFVAEQRLVLRSEGDKR